MRLFSKRSSLSASTVGLCAAALALTVGCKNKEEPKPAEPPKTEEPKAEVPKAEEKPIEPPAAVSPTEAVSPATAPVEATPAAAAAAGAVAPAAGAAPVVNEAAMKDPKLAAEVAPEEFRVKVETTKGSFTIAVHKKWSPKGVDRFYNLVKIGYFQDVAFFRAIAGFMAQFGIHGDPTVNNVWKEASIDDDPSAGQSNKAYTITFAKKGMPNSRSVQFFLNFKDNAMLDQMGFTPFGEVVEGKDVVDKINTEYGEGAPRGMGPDQMRVQAEGNAYLKKDFPNLDYIKSMTAL
jgi:peptidyl-prolyl cis-trans isomerase A (cyclophilin A)